MRRQHAICRGSSRCSTSLSVSWAQSKSPSLQQLGGGSNSRSKPCEPRQTCLFPKNGHGQKLCFSVRTSDSLLISSPNHRRGSQYCHLLMSPNTLSRTTVRLYTSCTRSHPKPSRLVLHERPILTLPVHSFRKQPKSCFGSGTLTKCRNGCCPHTSKCACQCKVTTIHTLLKFGESLWCLPRAPSISSHVRASMANMDMRRMHRLVCEDLLSLFTEESVNPSPGEWSGLVFEWLGQTCQSHLRSCWTPPKS